MDRDGLANMLSVVEMALFTPHWLVYSEPSRSVVTDY